MIPFKVAQAELLTQASQTHKNKAKWLSITDVAHDECSIKQTQKEVWRLRWSTARLHLSLGTSTGLLLTLRA